MVVEAPPHSVSSIPLLATRFFSPRLPPTRVARLRLLEQLEKGLQRPVILVSASPGFGKSSLISEWIHNKAGLKAGWLSLETSDREWGLFFRYLITAWQYIFPQVGAAVLSELNSTLSPRKEILVDDFLNDLLACQEAAGPEHALLVLDDYHRIENEAIHETVAYIVEHLPGRCHLAILTRADPPLPVARWRSHGQVLEVRADDLRFTSLEAAEFLNRAMGLDLKDEQIQILETRTEGWIVGLQMAALSLQGCSDTRAFVNDFGGSDRFVLDYLVEEVIERQSEEIQRFLLATAPLAQFCDTLCDAVLDVPSPYSQEILKRLEKANLFLIPLDNHRHWYRYHHLFADLLRVRLQQTDPDGIRNVNQRASKWFAQRNLWREAIQSALKIRDFELGADLFEQAISSKGQDFLYGGMEPLITPFPDAIIRAHPLLGLAKAISMIEISQLDGIEAILRTVENDILAEPETHSRNNQLGIIYSIQCQTASLLGDSQWIIESSRQATHLIAPNTQSYVDALIQLGVAYYYAGDLGQNDIVWEQALSQSQASGYIYTQGCCLDSLGRLCCHKGELNRAEQLFDQNLNLLSAETLGRSLRWVGATQRDYGDLLRERNQLDQAKVRMASGFPLCEKWESISGLGLAYLHLARILLADGDLPGVKAMLTRIDDLRRKRTIYPDLETLTVVFQAQVALVEKDFQSAWQILDACLQAACCQHELHREWVLIAQARVMSRTGRYGEALELLSGRVDEAQKKGRGHNWIEMILILAIVLDGLGRGKEAVTWLEKGLAFAQAQGFVRIFIDEGEPMQTLLEYYLKQSRPAKTVEFVQEVLKGFPATAASSKRGVKIMDLVEPISARELEVLQLVCQGLSNQEIATRLVLSVGTVKTHVHNLYGKLGVSDRPQAIVKAGQLGLN